MLRIQPSKISLIISTLLWIYFSLAINSCTLTNKDLEVTPSIENDSILSWITQGRNAELLAEERANLLKKAQKAADKSESDSLKNIYYSKLSFAYLKLKDSLRFRITNKKSLVLAQKVKDTLTEAYIHWDLATYYDSNAIKDSAYYHYSEAQKLFNTLGKNLLSGRIFYNMAAMQTDIKDYTGAEINTFKAIELLKPLNENLRLYRCYNLLGSISRELKEFDQSLSYFNVTEEYLGKIDNKQERKIYYGQLQNNIGNVYKDLGNFEKAKEYYRSAVNAHDSLRILLPKEYARFLDNLTFSRFILGDTLGVKQDLETALKIWEEEGDIEGLSLSQFTLAEFYLSQKDTANALASAQKAKEFAEEASNNKRLLASLGLLARLDSKNSLNYTQDYIALSDSLVHVERQNRNKFTRIRFETDEFIAENEALTRKKQIWTGLALGIFLFGVAVYVIIYQRAKNQALRFQQQQQASNQEIFDLMLSQKQKIEETKKAEQKRISEELHDGVLGKMLGARMVLTGLNKISNEEAIEERAKAIVALKNVEGEVRAISHELSHAAYHKINNFINSIQELLKNICSANGLHHTFEYDDTYDWDAMKGEIKINLYRMVQEIMQNAVKHAECKNILVSFVRTNSVLTVSISDDGKGYVSKSGKKGIGMRNIESRVSKLDGTWGIESEPNKGTKITLQLPLEDQMTLPRMMDEKQDLKKIG
jgi:signal transduction histidine kinase